MIAEELFHHCIVTKLVLEIISLLRYRDTLAMATTCRTLYTIVGEVPCHYYRHCLLQYLHLVPEERKVTRTVLPSVDQDGQDWRAVFREVHSLFRRLAECPPPGCPYQKYLRWLQGIVCRVLVGVSMLPASIRDMTERQNSVLQKYQE